MLFSFRFAVLVLYRTRSLALIFFFLSLAFSFSVVFGPFMMSDAQRNPKRSLTKFSGWRDQTNPMNGKTSSPRYRSQTQAPMSCAPRTSLEIIAASFLSLVISEVQAILEVEPVVMGFTDKFGKGTCGIGTSRNSHSGSQPIFTLKTNNFSRGTLDRTSVLCALWIAGPSVFVRARRIHLLVTA